MSEFPPSAVPECPAVDAHEALTPDAIEALLGDLRAWLKEAAEAPALSPLGPAEPALDLASVLHHFVALRHEVNLQTKAVRAQQEHNKEMLQELRQALDALAQSSRPRAQPQVQDAADTVRPLLKTLMDVHDALSLASREAAKLREILVPLGGRLAKGAEAPAPAPVSWWWRWLGPAPLVPASASTLQDARAAAEQIHTLLESFRAGYAMGLQRIERALTQHGLERIRAVGLPFDPEQMEVIEAVAGAGRPAGEVLEELRPGYRWNGRIFRYAQVQVARD